MTRNKITLSLIIGLALAAPLAALSFLADQALNIPFAAYSFFNWMTPLIPGPIITFGIDAMIDTMLFLQINVANSAKTGEQGMAVAMFLGLTTLVGAASWLLLRKRSDGSRPGPLGWLLPIGYAAFLLFVTRQGEGGAFELIGLGVLLALWLGALAWTLRRGTAEMAPAAAESKDVPTAQAAPAQASVEQLNRRQFLITLGTGAAAITVIGSGVGVALAANKKNGSSAAGVTNVKAGDLPNAGDPVVPAPGTRAEYTPVDDHYKVFLELEPSVIEAEGYVLPVMGLVDNPLMISVDDLYNRWESVSQFITLSCISGRIGTTLISTTKWTGISLQDILAEAGVQPDAQYLYIESADGFYESVPLELIENDPRIMLCHSWDDAPIPVDHGFPCRIWIPDRFGMKQPKWIVSMELTSSYREGYWVERGWDETAQVKTTSVIDTVAVDEIGTKNGQKVIPVGGIAWAGDRQISAVEVRVDGGSWEPAELRSPMSETTWVIWRYEWPFTAGDHVFEVRAYEGDGTPQIEEDAPARPSGSTGIDRFEASV